MMKGEKRGMHKKYDKMHFSVTESQVPAKGTWLGRVLRWGFEVPWGLGSWTVLQNTDFYRLCKDFI